jgi:glycine/D-amino acid oxidase-like deaminating enzyme
VSPSAGGRSPWIEQLDPDTPPSRLRTDVATDVAVVGAGIAGVSTAFFVLRETDARVLLLERDRVGHGATGHNAGQLTTYFERPLGDLVDAYGFDQAIAAQRAIDEAWLLLDEMVAVSGATVPIERFVGHMGMFTLDHLAVHLRASALRRAGGLSVPECLVADDTPFLGQIPAEYHGLYSTVPRRHVQEVLGTADDRYCAVLEDRKGCANGALLAQQVVSHLRTAHPERFQLADHTSVDRIVLDADAATIDAGGHRVSAARVVMCTNGFVDHVVENRIGGDIAAHLHHRVDGDVGYMVGFLEPTECAPRAVSCIRNESVGGETPYVYLTARSYDGPRGRETLVCIGGPEEVLDDVTRYSADWEFPATVMTEVDTDLLPIVCPARPPGQEYDYRWHGLMGYTTSRVRLIGFEPANPVLLYNLGCNGVGFLPSIHGGHRIARLLRGEDLEPSIFDPPDASRGDAPTDDRT